MIISTLLDKSPTRWPSMASRFEDRSLRIFGPHHQNQIHFAHPAQDNGKYVVQGEDAKVTQVDQLPGRKRA